MERCFLFRYCGNPWDFRNTASDRYPLLLFYHPLDIYRKQVIKQADVLLAMFLLGDTFSLEAKQRNFAFYDPLTTGDSSLSSCIEAIIAAQIGDLEKTREYGMAALLMDLADVGGNVNDGCHIASMGGTWMMLTLRYFGLRGPAMDLARSIVSAESLNGSWNPTCTGVTPDANGPVTVIRDPAIVACGDEPSSADAPAAPSGRSMISGPPMSTRFRALLTISSM